MLRVVFALCIMLITATPLHAGGGGDKAKKEGPANLFKAEFVLKSAEAGDPGIATQDNPNATRAVEIPIVAAPVTDDLGLIEDYLFVALRLIVKDGEDVWKVREKAHYLRHAVVMELHAGDHDFTLHIDPANEVRAAIKSAVTSAYGKDVFDSVEFARYDRLSLASR